MTLLESLESSEREGHQQVLLAILNRFGRMPRGGSIRTLEVFLYNLGSDVVIKELIHRAQKVFTNSTMLQFTNREFKIEVSKRRKTVINLLEE